MSRHHRKKRSKKDLRKIAKAVERVIKKKKRERRSRYSSTSSESSSGATYSSRESRKRSSSRETSVTSEQVESGKRSRESSAASLSPGPLQKRARRASRSDVRQASGDGSNVQQTKDPAEKEISDKNKDPPGKDPEVQDDAILDNGQKSNLDEKVLNVIGESINVDRSLAPPIHETIKTRWKEVLQLGLPKEVREELLKKYPTPDNCTFLDPPKLNKEINTAMTDVCKSRDARIAGKHGKLQACIGGLSKILSIVLADNKEENIPIIEAASDVARLLVDAIREETLIRRSLILSNINNSVKDSLTATEPDDWLFGKDLSDKLRQAKVTGQDARALAKVNTPSRYPKNQKTPLRHQSRPKTEAPKGYIRPTSKTSHRRYQKERTQSPHRGVQKSFIKKDYHQKSRL
ncbi:hypothetical protein TKK_0017461 [Trichogramma kaykai]